MDAQTELVPCPTCGATGARCRRPSGHAAAQWHVEREDAQARACGCVICRAWLAGRGQPFAVPAEAPESLMVQR